MLEEVTMDIKLVLKDGNQAEDLKAIFPQFEREILQFVHIYRGFIGINGGVLRWKDGWCACVETEDAKLKMTPNNHLCFYIGNDCRCEYQSDDLKEIKVCATSALSNKKKLMHHIKWE